jgi:hypothetical protein
MNTAVPQFAWNGQWVAELIFGIAALAALVYCAKVARRQRSPWPLFVFGGAALTVVYEPFNNFLAHCVWAEQGQNTVFTLFGRDMPLAACFVYMFYFAWPITWLVQRFEEGITTRQLRKYYGIGVVLCAAFEPLFCNGAIGIQWWHYYGDAAGAQPLAFTGLPMWWWFVNPMCLFAAAAVFHLLRRHVFAGDERTTWAFVPGGPLMCFASHGSCSAIMYMAISSGWSMTGKVVATVIAAGLAFGYMWIIGRMVCVPPTATAGAPSRLRAPSFGRAATT